MTATNPAGSLGATARANGRTRAVAQERTTTLRSHRHRVDPVYYLFLVPTMLLFTLLITGPALAGVYYSFTNYVGFGTYKFIGLSNYAVLFTDPRILKSYGFTLGFSIVTVIIVNILALGIAMGLNAKIKLKTALRGVFFIPMIVSGIVIAYVFSFLFSTSLPALATALHITPLETSMLVNPDLAWIAVVVVTAWQAIPGALIIYLAGLLAVPAEVYEAAAVDGATAWRQFRSITLPLMVGYLVINTVLSFKNFLNAYDIIVGLTNGGPGTSTSSVAMTIFTGFTGGDYAYQMANAVLFFIVTIVISIVQLSIINRRGVSL